MASLFTDPDLRRNNIELLQLPAIPPCGLPSNEDGEFLFEKYLSWSHVQSPFLRRDEVKSLSGRVFLLVPADQPASNHDLFRAFMILAVGAVFPFKNGTHTQHPEGYYLAALQHMGSDFLTRGLASIQDLLLICRFGIYHRIGTSGSNAYCRLHSVLTPLFEGTSIWDVIRLCGRLCIEQGLHLNENPSSNFMQAQMERRVFWQFYMIDRYSSTLLGKPFGIDDRDIETSFPADANDEDLVTANQSSRDFAAFRLSHITLETTEMAVFFTSVRLRQISSRIHTEFSRLARNYFESSQSHFAPGYIYTTLSRLMQELQRWRDDSPVFQQPKCLYESQSWYDLLLARGALPCPTSH
ncbi:fungal specific transcription factor domain-containing protein [Colletotrichum asianum]|uniref:Fungal specific transcription factor domain-containing protein n=1 Tax=Colletotrichum asianum TaxID=702518 RepID=A0A8H3WLT8_9PEZI|nr:fungal specific transcription factor domain-containing protein [Colletotrichum asianum]